MNKKILLGFMAAMSCASVQADTILGIYAGAYIWQTNVSGDKTEGFTTSGVDTKTKIKKDSGETNNVLFAALEHPIPFVPNVRLVQNSIKHDLKGGGSLDLTSTDVTLYYEILDNWVSLDVGLTGRMNNGEMDFSTFNGTPTGVLTRSVNSSLAMLYGKAQFELPFSGLGVGIELNTGGDGSDKATDTNLYLLYEMGFGLGFMGGYRTLDTDINTNRLDASLKVDGGYASIYYHF